ncbi:hypothetical protein OQA88_3301 [Cercophora sp. LCS_1]
MPAHTPPSTPSNDKNRRQDESTQRPTTSASGRTPGPSTDSGSGSGTSGSTAGISLLGSFLAQSPFTDATVHSRLSGASSTKPGRLSRVDSYTCRMADEIQQFEASYNK